MQFRLATKRDLPKLEKMYLSIVDNMNKNGICIWNEYYPFEEFENDIKCHNLWVLCQNKEIISAIGLFENADGSEFFSWHNNTQKAVYISRLGINVDYIRQGYAKKTLELAIKHAKENNAKFIRLLVAEINTPAINLYMKNNFKQVEGLRKEYSPTMNKTINELGFEFDVKKCDLMNC